MLGLAFKAILLILGVSLLYYLYEGIYWRLRFRKWKAQGMPMLEHSLLFGNIPAYRKLGRGYPKDAGNFRVVPLLMLQDWRKYFPDQPECPGFMLLDGWPISPPCAFVWDPEQIHRFTVEKPATRDSKFFMTPLTGGLDLLSVDVPTHREWRAKFSSGFSSRKLVSQLPSVLEEVEIFSNKIKHLAGANDDWGDVFQMEKPATSLTLDIIGRIALDVRLGEQLQEGSVFRDAMLEQIKEMTPPGFWTYLRRLNPTWQYNTWKNQKAMNSVILPRIRSRKSSGTGVNTLVDIVLGDRGDGNTIHAPAEKSDLVQGLIANIKAFAFAGHDTTATTICWCFYNLERHPSAMAKLRAEHEDVFGTDLRQMSSILMKSPQKINDLPYTLAVIKETLRLYGIVHSFRKGSASLELDSARGRVNTEGLLLVIAGPTLQLHPEIWYKAQDFIPERWLVVKGDPLYPPAHAWRPFEHGPLNCIGQELALIELKLVLASLVREVDVQPAWEKWDKIRGYTEAQKTTVDGQRAYPTNRGGGLIKPKDGMPVHVRLRRGPR